MSIYSQFIEGFRAGIRPTDAGDLTLGQIKKAVPMIISAPEIRKLANSFACSPKTLRRLLKRGVDVTDASAVACALAGQRNISAPMAEAVLAQLKTTETDDY